MFKLASFCCKSNSVVRAGIYLPKENILLDLDCKNVRNLLSLSTTSPSIDMNHLIDIITIGDPHSFSSSVKKILGDNSNIANLGIPITSATIKAPITVPRRNGN